MSKKLDKTEGSDEIRQLQPSRFEISYKPCYGFSPSLDTEEVGIFDSTSNPRLSDRNDPQKEDILEKSERNETFVDGSEENEFDCKKCGEGFKNFEGVIAHNCSHKVATKSFLDIKAILDLVKEKPLCEREAENSPDENINIDSSRSRTSSVAPHELRAPRRSYPVNITPCPKRKMPKIVYDEYPKHMTPPQTISHPQVLHNDFLIKRDSAAKNFLKPHKRSYSATGYRTPHSEWDKDLEQSPGVLKHKQLVSSSPELFRREPSRNRSRSEASRNLQLPRRYCNTTTEMPEIEFVGRVYTKYPALRTPPRSISSTHTQMDDSSRSVMDPVPVNLFQPHQMHNVQIYNDPAENVGVSTAISFDPSPWIYSTETIKDSPGNILIPATVNQDQLLRVYNTDNFTDSSKILINPSSANVLISPEMSINQMKSDSAEDLMNPTPVIFRPSPIYSAKSFAYRSGNIKNWDKRIFQSPQKYNTRMLTDSSGSSAHRAPVIVFQSPQTYATTIKTRSPETESGKYSFPKSSTSTSPRPTSPSFKELMPLLEESLLNTTADSSFQSSDDSSISPKESEKERSGNFLTFVTTKKSSPSSDDSSVVFKIPGTLRRSQSSTSSTSSGEETDPRKTWKKKYIAKYMSKDISIDGSSSLKPVSKLSIDSKELGKIYRSKSPVYSSDSAESIASEIGSGKSRSYSFRRSKRFSSSARASIKEYSGVSMNPKTKVASLLPQSSHNSDKVSSSKSKRAKESYAKSLPFSTPQKSSSNQPKKSKKKLKALSHWFKSKNYEEKNPDDSEA